VETGLSDNFGGYKPFNCNTYGSPPSVAKQKTYVRLNPLDATFTKIRGWVSDISLDSLLPSFRSSFPEAPFGRKLSYALFEYLPLSFERYRAVRQLDARFEELLEKLRKTAPRRSWMSAVPMRLHGAASCPIPAIRRALSLPSFSRSPTSSPTCASMHHSDRRPPSRRH